jgi:hypothetical protein
MEESAGDFFAQRQRSATRGGQTMSSPKKGEPARCAVVLWLGSFFIFLKLDSIFFACVGLCITKAGHTFKVRADF